MSELLRSKSPSFSVVKTFRCSKSHFPPRPNSDVDTVQSWLSFYKCFCIVTSSSVASMLFVEPTNNYFPYLTLILVLESLNGWGAFLVFSKAPKRPNMQFCCKQQSRQKIEDESNQLKLTHQRHPVHLSWILVLCNWSKIIQNNCFLNGLFPANVFWKIRAAENQ